MRLLIIIFIAISFNSYCQNYPAFEFSEGYFKSLEPLKDCMINLNIKKDKSQRINNYTIAKSYFDSNLVFIQVTGKSHTPITPCRIVADSTNKYGYYFVTLEELNLKGEPSKCKNTWKPPLENHTYKIYRKECFDVVVEEFNKINSIRELE